MSTFGPIEQEPRSLRPPYEEPDNELAPPSIGGKTATEHWRERLRTERMRALLEPLDELEVSAYERRMLEWLTGWETATVAVVAALLHRARAARPVSSGGHQPTGDA